jgi:integrase
MFLQNAALVCGEVQRACAAKPRKHLPLRTSPLLRAYLLNAPDPQTLTGRRDRAILAVLLGCGLRRAELLRLNVADLQQREGRWVLPDLTGKGNRIRTVTVPAGVRAWIDVWLSAAGITTGRIFRPVNKRDVIAGTEIRDEKAVWRLVMRYAQATDLGKLAPHDLRRTCAKLCRKAGGGAGADPAAPRPCLDPDHGAVPGDGAGAGSCRERCHRTGDVSDDHEVPGLTLRS